MGNALSAIPKGMIEGQREMQLKVRETQVRARGGKREREREACTVAPVTSAPASSRASSRERVSVRVTD